MILGVSAWLGNKIGMKESVVRICFIIGFFFGIGIVAYLILWLVKMLSK